jgi:hypothetical protein
MLVLPMCPSLEAVGIAQNVCVQNRSWAARSVPSGTAPGSLLSQLKRVCAGQKQIQMGQQADATIPIKTGTEKEKKKKKQTGM